MNKESGMTLVELIVSLAIVIIMMVAGIPLYESVQGRNQIAAQSNSLVKALKQARGEAISRSAAVVACPKNGNSSSCVASVSTDCDDDWLGGVIVFLKNVSSGDFEITSSAQLSDVDGDGSSDDYILRVFSSRADDNSSLCVKQARDEIEFKYDGTTDDNELFLLRYNEDSIRTVNCLDVNETGQIVLEKVEVSNPSTVSDTSPCSESSAIVVLPEVIP